MASVSVSSSSISIAPLDGGGVRILEVVLIGMGSGSVVISRELRRVCRLVDGWLVCDLVLIIEIGCGSALSACIPHGTMIAYRQ